MTFCMNVSRFMNLAAIFSLDLESQCREEQGDVCGYILLGTVDDVGDPELQHVVQLGAACQGWLWKWLWFIIHDYAKMQVSFNEDGKVKRNVVKLNHTSLMQSPLPTMI